MALFRWLVLLLLLVAGVSFALFAVTGQVRYKRYGLKIMAGTIGAAVFFFVVMLIQHFR